MPVKTVIITGPTGNNAFTIPSDCARIELLEVWAAGGSRAGALSGCVPSAGAGGGGGAYSANNTGLAVRGGGTAWYNIPVGASGSAVGGQGNAAGDCWFNVVSNAAPTLTSQGALAKGGAGGTVSHCGGVGGQGGQAASGVGTTNFSAGSGGNSSRACGDDRGGGGAAGPNGAGGNASGSTGGTGDNGVGGVGGARDTSGGNGTEIDATHGSGGGNGGGDIAYIWTKPGFHSVGRWGREEGPGYVW